jgi:Cu(I)/Ag(I) efflux system membrane fusion protein
MSRRAAWTVVLLAALGAAGVWLASVRRHEHAAAGARASSRLYQCSMHPQIVSSEPGSCPICGMRLQPVEEHRTEHRPAGAAPADAPPAPADPIVAGRAPFRLSSERQQLIGVTRDRVAVRELHLDIRAVGRVAYDPELYQAIVEYREALAARRALAGSPVHEAREGADAIVRAAALKLRQRGVAVEALAAVAPPGRDPVNLLLPGESVWVYVQVYEYELPLVQPGQEVTITVPSAPGRTYTARVASIDPILDPATRTARVRALVPTPDAGLRPETFVTARIRVPLGPRLAVPKPAVLDAGEHRIVFVVRGEGDIAPRAVRLGREAEDAYEVLAGLEAGEEVVTSANFLIDSESRFRAAVGAFGQAAAGGHAH